MTIFPEGFIWGASTAAYQIEGAADEGGRGPSIWDVFSATPGNTRQGQTGAEACDHYHRWPEDLDLARDIGLQAYRLSLSWSRLQPHGRGPLNPEGVAFYTDLLHGLRERGIRPFVTLYHWDLPQPLQDLGGWPHRNTALRFGDYADQVARAFGDLVHDWITINEAWCASFLGYGTGVHAPGVTDIAAAVRASHHLNLAHGLAAEAIRSANAPARLGPSLLLTDTVPASNDSGDLDAARRVDGNNNRWFLDPLFLGRYPEDMLAHYEPTGGLDVIRDDDLTTIARPIDFLGVNHYHRNVVAADPADTHLGARTLPSEPPVTSLGWGVTPASLYEVLVRVHQQYAAPAMYITENGAAYPDTRDGEAIHDPQRIAYLDRYLRAAAAAINDGVDLRGYFVWSLLDNYEWAEGYAARFGICYVDYATQQRIPKSSARWYSRVIADKALPPVQESLAAG
jgi:beta-glucosidase